MGNLCLTSYEHHELKKNVAQHSTDFSHPPNPDHLNFIWKESDRINFSHFSRILQYSLNKKWAKQNESISHISLKLNNFELFWLYGRVTKGTHSLKTLLLFYFYFQLNGVIIYFSSDHRSFFINIPIPLNRLLQRSNDTDIKTKECTLF